MRGKISSNGNFVRQGGTKKNFQQWEIDTFVDRVGRIEGS
jgi:hypothetical protein